MKKKFDFLPTNETEMSLKKWDSVDIIIVSGDAYIDHPSFGSALIGRYLESLGYKVGIIDQPDIKNVESFTVLGKPNLCFAVTAGNMDSMINHYTAQKKIRSNDAYSPNNKTGLRPDRASIKYTNMIRQTYKGIPVILGGIEASLRRIPHYDYWSDKVRNSILWDSKADLIIYGMAEKALKEVVYQLKKGKAIKDITDVPGTVSIVKEKPKNALELDEFNKNYSEKKTFFKNRKFFENYWLQNTIFQKFGNRYLKHNIPSPPLTEKEMDRLYNLPFKKEVHPKYKHAKIKAFEQIKLSVTSHRGCFGGCNFCSIGYHQGKTIQNRSEASIIEELSNLMTTSYYKGTITDIGGPSANMYGMYCKKNISQTCNRNSCIFPNLCPNLEFSHEKVKSLLSKVKNLNIKHTFVASGIRYDLALFDKDYISMIVKNFTGGHLKVAPEHKSTNVLNKMGKPEFSQYTKFESLFKNISNSCNKKQFLIPYIIVGHPGETLKDTFDLANYLQKNKIKLEQIQEFTPTPMSISTCMYYTEMDFETGKKIHVPKGREIRLMKACIQWWKPENKKLISEAKQKLHSQKK